MSPFRVEVGKDKEGEDGNETEGLDPQLVPKPWDQATRAGERDANVEAEEGDGVDDGAKEQRELLGSTPGVGVIRGQERDLYVRWVRLMVSKPFCSVTFYLPVSCTCNR